MIIIPQQFEDKDTYIVGELICNGCQLFKIEDLDKVCTEWEVSDDIKEAVRVAYEENSKVEEDWETLAKHEDEDIRYLVTKQGKCLDILIKDSDWDIRHAVAKQGYGLDILVKDPDYFVREAARVMLYM